MNKLEWVLGGILVVLLIIVAGLAISLWIQPNVTTNEAVDIAPTPIYEGETAMAAMVAADEKARAWQPDAKLHKASATWMQGVDINSLNSGASAWDFTYYSPSSRSLASMSVTEDMVSSILPGADQVELNPLDVAGGWKIDSPGAVRILMEAGGRAFVEREGTVAMVMTLTTDSDNGRLEWLLSLFSPRTENSFSIRLDAASGDILEMIEAP
ncbi:MAG: hypothetical protein CSA11_04910 [Chloroflexi bacterium]|nr:MAG: hypothetical protein CSB13_01610 [Chloroflexota bacterium]PIE81337.1 MAG: hypothetical protein CSA11_04910 [Chloroflexota bacterium]